MSIDDLAALGVLAAGLCLAFVKFRGRSEDEQAFSCQLGDVVLTGRYRVVGDTVHVRCERGALSGPLGRARPIHVAERLLAQIHRAAGG
ncbi:MAG: hypothetical protein Q7S93_16905 [Phenylobacterium sp.]|uniref:hypothetical protein n=1 Tax=Phenylobacterium sp. TaxID=1871053 RepID=UPI002725669E|nr:hypothetical protein [Phenylobacterium sp.]MDO8411734.1 hypothetical protein [Phenylobacterium sp.]